MRLFIKFSVNILLCVIFIQGCDDLLNNPDVGRLFLGG